MKFNRAFLKVGITGGIGSGKTTVCKIIKSLGYPLFYSDLEAKKIINGHPSVIHQVQAIFGTTVYKNGILDRALVASQAFKNPSLLQSLNAIVHPEVRRAFDSFVDSNKSKRLIFNEAAILFETGAYKNFDATILVTAPLEMRVDRVMRRDLISKNEVLERMKNQWPDEEKAKLTDYLIQNDGRPLEPQIESVMNLLLQKLEQ